VTDGQAELLNRLATAGLEAALWSNGPGAQYAGHTHAFDKVLVVSRGSITFGLEDTGEDIAMRLGDRLDLPAGTSHDATVGADGVECLEAHVPAGTLAARPRRRPAGSW
jgi:uncharacterized protein YjlB